MATAKFSLEAGLVVRGAIKRGLKRAAFKYDVGLDIDEQRGWFESVLLCRASGDIDNIKRFMLSIDKWISDINKS